MTGLRVFFVARHALASIDGVKRISMAVDVQTELNKRTFRFLGLFK
jgi:hypothetical protein